MPPDKQITRALAHLLAAQNPTAHPKQAKEPIFSTALTQKR
jgi:hypothetical protein